MPIIWSAVSEIVGRKVMLCFNSHKDYGADYKALISQKVYLASLCIALAGAIVSATAQSINILIAMRCLQAIGYVYRTISLNILPLTSLKHSTAAILSIGAATLADIYDPHERGTMMGIYYW